MDLEVDDLNSEADMVMTGHDEDDEESVASGAYEILVDEHQDFSIDYHWWCLMG